MASDRCPTCVLKFILNEFGNCPLCLHKTKICFELWSSYFWQLYNNLIIEITFFWSNLQRGSYQEGFPPTIAEWYDGDVLIPSSLGHLRTIIINFVTKEVEIVTNLFLSQPLFNCKFFQGRVISIIFLCFL